MDLCQEDLGQANALECARTIADGIEGYERVVLVGTSCSGMLIPVVATLRPIEHLVFICAGLPDIGRSVTDQINQDGVLHEEWRFWTDGFDTPEAATRFMFNDCDSEALQWSLTTVRLFRPAAYDEVTPLEAWPDIPKTYLLGLEDRIISQEWAHRAARERLGLTPVELPTGHCPQNSQPELLSDVLREKTISSPPS
jgi:pimeloyl-ACP methyl ester carboxylesterase